MSEVWRDSEFNLRMIAESAKMLQQMLEWRTAVKSVDLDSIERKVM